MMKRQPHSESVLGRSRSSEIERRFQSFFELGVVGMAIENPDGTWVAVNDRLCELFGYSRTELFKRHWLDLTHPEDRDRDLQLFERLIQGDLSTYTIEKKFVRKDGAIIHLRLSVSCSRKENGAVDKVFALAVDISDRKHAEEVLRESERKYRSMVESAVAGVFRTTLDGKLLFANTSLFQMLGYDAGADYSNFRIESLYRHPNQRTDALEKLRRHGSFLSHELELVRKNGTIMRALSCATLEGNVVSGMLVDISQRYDVEQALIEAEQIWHDTFEALEDGVCVVDASRRILNANGALANATGWSQDAMVGRRCCEVIHGQNRAAAGCPLTRARRTGRRQRAQLFVKGRWLEETIDPIRDSIGNIVRFVHITSDVTDRRKADTDLLESKQKLEMQNCLLEQKNIALAELMGQIDRERSSFEKQVLGNIANLVMPVIDRLKSHCSGIEAEYVALLEQNIEEIANSFGSSVSQKLLGLTYKETEISNMIRQGFSSKDIARLLNLSTATVQTHRKNIRRKLGIQNAHVNLSTYLLSM